MAALSRLLLVLLLAGCAHNTSLRERGLQPATSTGDELRGALEGRRIAVLVGIDSYDSSAFPALRFAGSDAAAFGALLEDDDGGDFDRVLTLNVGPKTRRAEILATLKSIRADLVPQDEFVFYFSGHGTLANTGDGAKLFLLPSDASPSDLVGTALDLDTLRDFFSLLPAERKVLVVDACFHGEGKSVSNPTIQLDPDVLAGLEQSTARGMGSGEAHLFASTFGYPAFEDDDLGQGVYTHYLMQGLSWARGEADRDADGVVTAWESHDFARLRTQQHTSNMQVPEASIRVVGSNDLVFAGDRGVRADRAEALVFNYGPLSGAWSGSSLVIDGRSKGVFPAAFSVAPGDHHVEVRGPDGELLLDGYTTFASGESVRVSELPIRTREDRALLSLRVGGGGGPASRWGTVWGDGWLGLEGWTGLRKARGPGKGLFIAGGFGAAVAPQRGSFTELARPAMWLEVEGGWGMDVRRFRFRMAWQARGTLLPVAKRTGPAHELEPEEAGWLIGSMGPALHVGVLMSRRTSFIVAATLQGAPLDLDGGGTQLHPFGAITAGVELGL